MKEVQPFWLGLSDTSTATVLTLNTYHHNFWSHLGRHLCRKREKKKGPSYFTRPDIIHTTTSFNNQVTFPWGHTSPVTASPPIKFHPPRFLQRFSISLPPKQTSDLHPQLNGVRFTRELIRTRSETESNFRTDVDPASRSGIIHFAW